jgi:hypothetical protein
MSTPLVFTESLGKLVIKPLTVSTQQSFRLVELETAGRFAICGLYLNKNSCITAGNPDVLIELYSGYITQQFVLEEFPDGSYAILNHYTQLALTTVDDQVQMRPYFSGNRNQRFEKFLRTDNSTGFRKVTRSVFSGTPDPMESITRIGNWFFNSYRQATGFYTPKNTRIKLEIACENVSGQSDPKLWVGAPFADPDTQYSSPRVYSLQEGENTITDPGGGIIYLQLTGERNTANLSFLEGIIDLPYFEAKKTRHHEYMDMLQQWNLSPYVELYSERSQVTVSRSAALAYAPTSESDMDTLMWVYETIISTSEDVIGLDASTPLHTRAAWKYHLVLGNYGGAGGAHASHGHTAYMEYFAQEMLTPEYLKKSWGVPHELGHQNQMLGYKAPEFSEVTNNISALAVQRAFGLPSILLAKGDDGLDTWAILLNKLNTPQAKIEHLDLYERLAVLEQLRLALGDDFWKTMNKITREKWHSNGYSPAPSKAYDNFALFACMAAKTNLLDYFTAWGFPITESGKLEIQKLNLPSPTAPIQTLREKASLDLDHLPHQVLIDCTLNTELRKT